MFRSIFGRKKSKGNDEYVETSEKQSSDEYVVVDQTGSTHTTSLYPQLDGSTVVPPGALPYPLATSTNLLSRSDDQKSQNCSDKLDMLERVPFSLAPWLRSCSHRDGLEALLYKSKSASLLLDEGFVQFDYDFKLEKSICNIR